jgi:signal transduction histidine kinase
MDLTSRSHRLYRRAVWLTALLPVPALLMVIDPAYRTGRLAAWAGCLVLFLVLMMVARSRPAQVIPWAFAQSGVALAATAILPTSAEGAWLVAVIAQIAPALPLAATVAMAILQTAAFAWLLSLERPLELAVDVPIAWLAFQIFAALLTHVARSEAEHRTELVERNVQLLSARQLLAERTRAAERLRMARDLHDGLGHHLAALSLNLEAAAHLTPPEVREHVARAQQVTRALLEDVRRTVSEVRHDTADPMTAIRSLVESIEHPVVHIDGPPELAVDDPSYAETITRVVQEIVTNAVRHAQARNLWISIARKAGGIDVDGRDDGQGAGDWRDGHGLRGMRERLALIGGSLDVRTAPGAGFEVRAHIPLVEGGS